MENTNKEVKKAKEVLEEISQDKHERYLTELRQKYILDQNAIEDAGYDKGVEETNKKIVIQMKKRQMDIKLICQITGLTEEEIKNIN